MNAKTNLTIADYFGLEVAVISRMEYRALICYQGQESIVETANLVFSQTFKQAA